MNIESRLIERCGATGARLHMGRSRNDQVNTTVRLYLRKELLEIWNGLHELISVLLKKAEEHAETVVPGYTHLQQAQPISMGQFWMAHTQAFLRDAKRLFDAYDAVDECPLGCGALAGSTLPLDREFTCNDLGFSRMTANSMDTVAHRDHFMDILYFASVFGGHVSRLSEDLIIYFSTEFGWIKLPDAFCTGSSIMPQKKNPDVLEILRGKAGQMNGALMDLLTMTKGIPPPTTETSKTINARSLGHLSVCTAYSPYCPLSSKRYRWTRKPPTEALPTALYLPRTWQNTL